MMHIATITSWLIFAGGTWLAGYPHASLACVGAAVGAWSLSLLQAMVGDRE